MLYCKEDAHTTRAPLSRAAEQQEQGCGATLAYAHSQLQVTN